MNREEFRKLLFPLSEKEKEYQRHPELSARFYTNLMEKEYKSNDIYYFDTASFTLGHGEILPDTLGSYPYTDLYFSRQTRFSTVPLHRHRYIEMNYVYSGSCTAVVNGTKIALSEGDVCIMDVEVVHTIALLGENDIVLNCIMGRNYFNHYFIGRLADSGIVSKFISDVIDKNSRHNQYLLFHTSPDPRIKDLFENIFCEYLEPGICSKAAIDSYMTVVFIRLAQCYQQVKEQEYHNNSRSYITEILQYIDEHCTDCSLAKTAEHFNFNPAYLSRLIKKATGQTFKEIVDGCRLTRAAFMLQNTDLSINEIASQCGWSNQKQFYKKFEAEHTCKPNEYRKQRLPAKNR